MKLVLVCMSLLIGLSANAQQPGDSDALRELLQECEDTAAAADVFIKKQDDLIVALKARSLIQAEETNTLQTLLSDQHTELRSAQKDAWVYGSLGIVLGIIAGTYVGRK